MSLFRRGLTKPREARIDLAVADAWSSYRPAFLDPEQAADALVGSAWVTMLPLTLAVPEAPGAWELQATGDSGHGLAREGVVSEAVPAGTSLRLVEVARYDHISGPGQAFVFEVTDGRMVGTRLNIWDIERDVAWQQRLPSISRAISMIVPAGAPEVADRDRAYARLRDVETTLEAYRRFANEQWDLLARGLTRPLEAAELPQFDRP